MYDNFKTTLLYMVNTELLTVQYLHTSPCFLWFRTQWVYSHWWVPRVHGGLLLLLAEINTNKRDSRADITTVDKLWNVRGWGKAMFWGAFLNENWEWQQLAVSFSCATAKLTIVKPNTSGFAFQNKSATHRTQKHCFNFSFYFAQILRIYSIFKVNKYDTTEIMRSYTTTYVTKLQGLSDYRWWLLVKWTVK